MNALVRRRVAGVAPVVRTGCARLATTVGARPSGDDIVKQSPSTATRARRRIPLLGSLLALVVLALGVLVAPAAGATPGASSLGSVRQLTVDLLAGRGAPDGLDRSGAAFRFTSTSSSLKATCLTSESGRCVVSFVDDDKAVGSASAAPLASPSP